MSNIKINDVPQRIQYTATGGQTQFTIPFPFFDNSYVYVWLNGIQIFQGGAPGQYVVTGAGSPSGGLVTFNTAATLNDIVTIEGIMPIDRTSIYSATISNLTGSDLNGDFNREVVMLQQLNTTQSFMQLQYAPWTEISQDLTVTTDRYIPLLPALAAWRMNATGTEIETFQTPSSGGLAPDDGTYLLQVADVDLPNAQVMGDLASGLVVNTASTGVQLTRILAGTANQLSIANASGIAGNPTVSIAPNPTIPGTEYILLPSGTTAQRPVNPVDGMVRYNTTNQSLEVYEGGSWDSVAGGVVDSIVGTANQIDVDNTDPQNPVLSLSATLDLPGTFTIQSSIVLDSIIDDDTFATATDTNIPTSESVKAYVDTTLGGYVLSVSGTANQVDVDNTDPQNPIAALSATLDLPGTFNIQSSTAVDEIINDDTFATATATNLATALSIKNYVDSVAAGFTLINPVRVASTGNLVATYANGASGVGATLTVTALGVASIDGVALSLNDRVLFKDQSTTYQNGIYYVSDVGSGGTSAVYTRATDFDQPSEIDPGDLVPVLAGSTLSGTLWLQTATVTSVGVSPITFIQFAAAYSNVVTLDGIQTITGAKTFSSASNAFGTPLSITLTNATGLPLTTGVTGVLPIANGGTNKTSVTTAPSASSWSGWDANSNLSAVNHIEGFTSITSAAGTTTLLVGSNYIQQVVGSTTQTIQMPVASTLAQGQSWQIINNSTGVVTVNSSGSNLIISLQPNTAAIVTCILTSGTSAASWTTSFSTSGGGSGIIDAWVQYTPTFTGFGTATNVNIWSRRVGGNLEVRGTFTCGTTTSTEARMTIGYNGTSANVTSSSTVITAIQLAGAVASNGVVSGGLYNLIEASVTYLTFSVSTGTNNALNKQNASNIFSSSANVSINATIPISGWS